MYPHFICRGNFAAVDVIKVHDLRIPLLLRKQLRHDNHSVGDVFSTRDYVKKLQITP